MAPDVVQGWMYHGNLAASLTTPKRTAVIWGIRQTLYDLRKERLNTRLVIRASTFLLGRCNRIVYNSLVSARQHEAAGYPCQKRVIIPNGFDLAAFRPQDGERAQIRATLGLSPDDFVFGNFARFHPMKAHGNLIAAFAHVANIHPEAHLILVGTGVDPSNEFLRSRVNQFGLESKVFLLGERRDIAKLMVGLDVYVSASEWGEGFPNVIGEAMACAVPCVTTDVGESSSIVGDSGWVVSGTGVSALADSLVQAISTTYEDRFALGLHARARIQERYSVETVTNGYEELYSQLASRLS